MDGSRSEAATESKDLFLLNGAIDFAGHSHHYLRTLAISLFLQLPSSFVLLMDCRTLGGSVLPRDGATRRAPSQWQFQCQARSRHAQPELLQPHQGPLPAQCQAPCFSIELPCQFLIFRSATLAGRAKCPSPHEPLRPLTSLLPPSAASGVYLRSAGLCLTALPAACRRVFRTAPAPAPPFWRCRR